MKQPTNSSNSKTTSDKNPHTELGIELERIRATTHSITKILFEQTKNAQIISTAKNLKQAVPSWLNFIASYHVIRHDVERVISVARRSEKLLASLGVDVKKFSISEKEVITIVVKELNLAKLPEEFVSRIARRIIPPKTAIFLPQVIEKLEAIVEAMNLNLHEKLNNVSTLLKAQEEVGGAVAYIHEPGHSDDRSINCFLNEFWTIVCIVIFLALIISIIIGAAEAAERDERPREILHSLPCPELIAFPNRDLIMLIEELSRGPTGDDDERAILRLFSCLPCSRVSEIWRSASILDPREGSIGHRLLSDFDGVEFDRLMLRLRECGIISFAAFDDDASALFINSFDCAVLSRLSNADIRQLLLNLFRGYTGNRDELAIIKLMECLPNFRVFDLLQMPNLSYDDFDDEVDGDNWVRLRRKLEAALLVWG